MSKSYDKLKLGDLADFAAGRWGDREALCFEDRRWTFAEFASEVDRCAKGLIALGVEPGERVALWMTNRPEWLVAMVAVAKVGAALVPLNTRYRTDDVAYTLAQSRSATLIVNARSGPVDYATMLAEAMPDLENGAPGTLTLDVRYPGGRRDGATPPTLYIHVLGLHDPDAIRDDVHGLEQLVLSAVTPAPLTEAVDASPAAPRGER